MDNELVMNSIEELKKYVNHKTGNSGRHYAHLIISDWKYEDHYDTYIFVKINGDNSYILLEGNFNRFITKNKITVQENQFIFIAGSLMIKAINHIGQEFSISITPLNKK